MRRNQNYLIGSQHKTNYKVNHADHEMKLPALDRLRRSGDDGPQQKLFNERIRGNLNNVINIGSENNPMGHSSQASAAFDHDSLFE